MNETKMTEKDLKVETSAPLLEYAKKLAGQIEELRDCEGECSCSTKEVNLQFGNGLDGFLLSKAFGFDMGYNDCREFHLLWWVELLSVTQRYSQYKVEIQTHGIDQPGEWMESILCKLNIWDSYLKDLLDRISVPDKDAFLFGWCEGVSTFYLNICSLIKSPPNVLPRKSALLRRF